MRIGPFKLVFLIIAGFLAWQTIVFWPQIRAWLEKQGSGFVDLERADPSIAYLLTTNRWLEFDIQEQMPFVRIISNGNILSSLKRALSDQWAYALDYQILDRQGKPAIDNTYYYETKRTLLTNEVTGKVMAATFYLDEQLTPLNSRVTFINLLKSPVQTGKGRLRLRLRYKDPAVYDVIVRVYFREDIPTRKLRYLWERLSKEQKAALARGNVYSADGMSEQERLNVLRYHWPGVAPEGIGDLDYQRRTLYIREDLEGDDLEQEWTPAGLFIDAGRRGTIPLPDQPGQLRLEFSPLPATPTNAPPSPVRLEWFGLGAFSNAVYAYRWNNRASQYTLPNAPGLLEISPASALAVRAFLTNATGQLEITPEPSWVRVYACQPGNPVSCPILHINDEPTFLRVDLRLSETNLGPSSFLTDQVRYEMLNARQQPVLQGLLTLNVTNSFYDQLVSTNGPVVVSDPALFYFILPREVTALRLSTVHTNRPIYVCNYNRPANLARQTRVPEDYLPFNRNEVEQQSWYYLRPTDHEQRMRAATSLVARVQPRPPAYDPDLLAGRYQYETFMPQGRSQGRYLLLPKDDQEPFRQELLPVAFQPLATQRALRVTILGQPPETNIAPALIVLNPSARSATLLIEVDGREYYRGDVFGSANEVRLPPLGVGAHTLKISAPTGVQTYMNFLAPGKEPALLKRFCNRIDSRGLTFNFTKRTTTDESLLIRVHSSYARQQRCRLHVRLLGSPTRTMGPHDGVTFTDRWYDLVPAPGPPVAILGTAGDQADPGQLAIFPLGADLAPGDYPMEITLLSDDERYLTLAQTIAGDYEQRQLKIQPKGPGSYEN